MPSPDAPPDLAARIDRSVGPGPDLALDVDGLLARGRRVRRRRRAAGVAAALVVVAGAAAAVPGWPGHADRATDYAASPTPSATATPRPLASSAAPSPPTAAERERLKRLADRAATFEGDGRVRLAPGARIVWSLDNPFGLRPPAWSRGLAVELEGHELWYAMSGPGDGSSGGSTQYYVSPDDGLAAFERFVLAQRGGAATPATVGPGVWPDVTQVEPARLGPDGSLVARAGFEVVDQRAGVDVGRAWAGAEDETAAALVRATGGPAYFVLARRFEGKPAQYVVVPRAGNGADLDAFLALATQRYAASER